MHVAIFSHGGISDPKGQTFIPALVNLVHALSDSCSITVYTPAGPGQTASEKMMFGGRIRYLPASSLRTGPAFLWASLRAFREDHRRQRFDIVHGLWGYPAGVTAVLIARTFSLPSVVSLLGGEGANIAAIRYGHMRTPGLRRVTLWTCRNATVLCALTRFQYECLRRHGLSRPDVRVIPLGVPPSWVTTALPVAPAVPPYRFLHVGNLTEVKDQETLLRALVLMRQQVSLQARIVGPDYLGGRIQRIAADFRLLDAIEFHGYVHPDRLIQHYTWADILLHTSLYEGQAVVVAEAAARGVVVCGTEVGLISDLGKSCAGVSTVGSAEELAGNALTILRNPELFATLQRHAYEWAAQHTMSWSANEYCGIYKGLLKRG
jgi:glycosyltransferase involved in cell wall biosynthesis